MDNHQETLNSQALGLSVMVICGSEIRDLCPGKAESGKIPGLLV
jgi:hypothetical protein